MANKPDELDVWILRLAKYANTLTPYKLDDPIDPIVQDGLNEAKQAIQALIRTEKLKLLAEIRERVVGEDERIDIQSEFDKIDVPHLETDKYPGLDGVRQASRNIYRNHHRAELTKLEAEL